MYFVLAYLSLTAWLRLWCENRVKVIVVSCPEEYLCWVIELLPLHSLPFPSLHSRRLYVFSFYLLRRVLRVILSSSPPLSASLSLSPSPSAARPAFTHSRITRRPDGVVAGECGFNCAPGALQQNSLPNGERKETSMADSCCLLSVQ